MKILDSLDLITRQEIIKLLTKQEFKECLKLYGNILKVSTINQLEDLSNKLLIKQEQAYEINNSYWYDKERDVYVIHLKNKKRPWALRGSIWREMREAYSNWDKSPASINEMTRKFGMSRTTIVSILKIMTTTHDSPPWSEEELIEKSEEELIQELLRKKEESVLVKAERKEWSKVKNAADKWRRIALASEELKRKFNEVNINPTVVKKVNIKKSKYAYSIVISPTDFHWGMYAPEHTDDPYDRTEARKRLFSCTEKILKRSLLRGKPEQIIVALGGDGVHFDNYQKTSTKGTPQDSDGSPEEVAWSWIQLCRDYVDYLRQISNVTLLVIPGNHDRYSAVFLRSAMSAVYESCEDVTVVTTLKPRQYVKYGANMVTFMHGDIGSTKDWPAIIAGEEPKMWGQTKHKFIFTGHLHTERELPTFGGVTVYRMPSLAGLDNWHNNSGYLSRKGLIGYIICKRRGVIGLEIEPV